jgi:putative transposase
MHVDWRIRSMRRPVCNIPGHAHELTFSCYHRFAFLQSELTCQWLADAINEAREEHNFAIWAYVFMPEHAHVLIYPKNPVYNISTIWADIKGPVGRKAIAHLKEHAPHWLPKITVKRGKRTERRFWQAGGGFDRNVFEPHTLLAMIDYIHANPVRRGLITRAEDWKWSSAGWIEGKNSLRPDLIDVGGFTLFLKGRG